RHSPRKRRADQTPWRNSAGALEPGAELRPVRKPMNAWISWRVRSSRKSAYAVCIACSSLAGHARAETPEQRPVATVLFDEGRKLLEEARYDEACPKFLASARLVRSSGTLLNLADCYEHLGRTA